MDAVNFIKRCSKKLFVICIFIVSLKALRAMEAENVTHQADYRLSDQEQFSRTFFNNLAIEDFARRSKSTILDHGTFRSSPGDLAPMAAQAVATYLSDPANVAERPGIVAAVKYMGPFIEAAIAKMIQGSPEYKTLEKVARQHSIALSSIIESLSLEQALDLSDVLRDQNAIISSDLKDPLKKAIEIYRKRKQEVRPRKQSGAFRPRRLIFE